ncbi:amidohydrolase [Sphingobium nicotianae]|uniref:Amidohydrolase n=1 Tax=Sphingobium nicotianae TaxID=2782607 RepID=A0A9X1DBC5_9SPHN|nr:amidohydrolase [Sphingobium nicotianae]MBT2186804.1 amidohydrolase [Sphingobium nicotianae]
MKKSIYACAAIATLMSSASTLAQTAADMVLFNGKVLTVDKAFSVRSAVAVKDGKIIAVGGPELVKRYTGAQRIDLKGRTLMPGFIDTHQHVYGLAHRSIEPDKARSIAEIQQMIAAKAKELGPGEWINGYGWDEALLAEKRVPTRADLDAAAPDNPVVLTRAGGHSSVSNSAALKLAKIDTSTPDPDGGLIERGADKEPNGIIRERSDLVTHLVPPDSKEQMRPSYIARLKWLLSLGITTVMEAFTSIDDEPVGKGGLDKSAPGGTFSGLHSWAEFRSIYGEMGADLPRMISYIAWPGAERLKAFPFHTGYGDDRLKLGPIGESPYDGGFTGPTAYTKQDYKGLPGFRGKTFYSQRVAREIVATSAALGWQVGIHAIGDQAIEDMARIYDEELKARPKKDHRWFLSHYTMIPSVETMKMMAANGTWGAAQPNFLYNLEGRYEQTLDGYRLQHNNPVAVPFKYGVKLAFGSDNLPIGPMVGLYAAITRKGPDGTVFGIEEAVSRQEAIRLYTEKAAYLGFDEKKKGTLEVGKFADMIVLDKDPLSIAPEELLTMKVDMTIVGGRIVYQANQP